MDFFTSLEGFIFGFTHVVILLIGYYSGWSINRLLKITTNGYVVGIVGAVLAHVISDLIAALLDPTMRSRTLGLVLGGLIPLLAVPILEKYVIKSNADTVLDGHSNAKIDNGENDR